MGWPVHELVHASETSGWTTIASNLTDSPLEFEVHAASTGWLQIGIAIYSERLRIIDYWISTSGPAGRVDDISSRASVSLRAAVNADAQLSPESPEESQYNWSLQFPLNPEQTPQLQGIKYIAAWSTGDVKNWSLTAKSIEPVAILATERSNRTYFFTESDEDAAKATARMGGTGIHAYLHGKQQVEIRDQFVGRYFIMGSDRPQTHSLRVASATHARECPCIFLEPDGRTHESLPPSTYQIALTGAGMETFGASGRPVFAGADVTFPQLHAPEIQALQGE